MTVLRIGARIALYVTACAVSLPCHAVLWLLDNEHETTTDTPAPSTWSSHA